MMIVKEHNGIARYKSLCYNNARHFLNDIIDKN